MGECMYSFKHSKPPHRAPRSRMRGALTPPPPTPAVPCRHRGGGGFFNRFLQLDSLDTKVGGSYSRVDVMPNTKTSVPLGKRKLVIHRPVQSPCHHHSPNSAQEPATIGGCSWFDTIRQHRYASCSYYGNKMTSTIFGFSDVTWLP